MTEAPDAQLNPPEAEPFYDLYGSEIGDGEKYFENEHGEAIHPDNLKEYALEYCELNEKTR